MKPFTASVLNVLYMAGETIRDLGTGEPIARCAKNVTRVGIPLTRQMKPTS
jgi:hypothetical protein